MCLRVSTLQKETANALTTAFLLAFRDSHSSILFICTAGEVDGARIGGVRHSSSVGTWINTMLEDKYYYYLFYPLRLPFYQNLLHQRARQSALANGQLFYRPCMPHKRCHSDVTTPTRKMNALSGLLQDSLISTGHVECCTIIKRSDGSVVAASAEYEVMVI